MSSISPTPSALSRLNKFPCNELAYESQTQSLYQINLYTGAYTLVGTANFLPDAVNALAYHPGDNYLYAVAQRTNAYGYIVRIGTNGTFETVPGGIIIQTGIGNPVPNSMTSGTIDSNLIYWLAAANGFNYVMVDLNPGSSTYGTVIGNGTTGMELAAPPQSQYYQVNDWAVLGGYTERIYAVAGQPLGSNNYDTHLLYWNTTSKAWTKLQTYSGLYGDTGTNGISGRASWGAMYSTADGYIYATENWTGRIYRFNVVNVTSSAYNFVSQGPAGLTNDGARCSSGPPVGP